MKKYLIMLLIIICSSFSVFGEEGQNKEISDLKQRIEQLEREDKEVKINYSAKELFEKNDKKIEEIEKKIQENRENILTWLPWENILNKASLPIIILLIPALLWIKKNIKDNLLKEVQNDIKEEITSKIKKNIDDEIAMEIEKQSREVSNKILDEYRERILSETILRLSKRIVVLSKKEAQNPHIKKFFQHKEYGFKSPVYLDVEKYEYKNDADLIIFDNSPGIRNANNVDEEFSRLMSEKVNIENSKVVFLYVSFEGIFFDKKIKNSNRINAVTSEITLYEQIMNSLKYQDFLEKSSN